MIGARTLLPAAVFRKKENAADGAGYGEGHAGEEEKAPKKAPIGVQPATRCKQGLGPIRQEGRPLR